MMDDITLHFNLGYWKQKGIKEIVIEMINGDEFNFDLNDVQQIIATEGILGVQMRDEKCSEAIMFCIQRNNIIVMKYK